MCEYVKGVVMGSNRACTSRCSSARGQEQAAAAAASRGQGAHPARVRKARRLDLIMHSRRPYAAVEVPWGRCPGLAAAVLQKSPQAASSPSSQTMAALRWRWAAFKDETRSKVAFVVLTGAPRRLGAGWAPGCCIRQLQTCCHCIISVPGRSHAVLAWKPECNGIALKVPLSIETRPSCNRACPAAHPAIPAATGPL